MSKVSHWKYRGNVEMGLQKQAGTRSLMFDLHGMLSKVKSFLWLIEA